MNQYGALTLLKNLDIKELQFKTKYSYETIIPPQHKLLLIDGEIYYCKDQKDFEDKSQYNWDIQHFTYFYDTDVDAVVIEVLAWESDICGVEKLDELYAIVRKDFLEAYGIKLVFGKEDKDDN